MGSYLTVYLGPYVECTYRNETQEVEVVGCTNSTCPEYAKRERGVARAGKYCPSCASPIGASKRLEPHRPSSYDVLGEREEIAPLGWDKDNKFLRFGSNIGTSKVNGNLGAPRSFYPKEEGHADLTRINVEAETRWFEDRFTSSLERLRAAYDNVTVKWGLHMFYR